MTVAVRGAVELLERAVGYTLGSLHEVTADVMDGPTPCREWNLHQLLAHLNDGLLTLHDALDSGSVDLEPVGGQTCPVDVLQTRASGLLGALSTHDGRPEVSIGDCSVPTFLVAGCGALELTVHGWDVAQACGVRSPIPRKLASELLELAPLLVTDAERPGRFAAPVDVPAAASPGDQLIAWLGRTP
jgi:uncharacterized protein (TIGR03086 family)